MPPNWIKPPERTDWLLSVRLLVRFSVASTFGLIDTGIAEWLNKSARAVTKFLLRQKSLS